MTEDGWPVAAVVIPTLADWTLVGALHGQCGV